MSYPKKDQSWNAAKDKKAANDKKDQMFKLIYGKLKSTLQKDFKISEEMDNLIVLEIH